MGIPFEHRAKSPVQLKIIAADVPEPNLGRYRLHSRVIWVTTVNLPNGIELPYDLCLKAEAGCQSWLLLHFFFNGGNTEIDVEQQVVVKEGLR